LGAQRGKRSHGMHSLAPLCSEALEGASASISRMNYSLSFREFVAALGGRIGSLCHESARNQKKVYDSQELRSSSIPEPWLQRRLGYGKCLEMHLATHCGL
jgi:hypothetical protein